ncbi:class I SAM-dependent methyltransferase [Brachyspira hyodysenteriae]|uniref:class I SAM-dependent methyltransferase n=1 Tax=Brachyspira hyodysenteriae TaxID=159 RepID=UPI00063DD4EA|nr:class I SAM-dependent methyltransferase [Brachyspira hyodysenteriae]KLI33151.1 methyltransferase type 11 [Brachyspira hyodysenteriae]KLI39657.1 methyltransferase type 11 [Brachyspira hyodysenteriae]MCZ9839325.1 class I SAM-dependent methyltransferase [Brachyspira hyodysenteriae]MCZ9846974.1 class I SAM-dependent methyltransferase [Brachyspira hyodysenteriae]MCZ9850851.1 class I SAM-dependent methyltransferase [Brachyspira hyodysenteriae]
MKDYEKLSKEHFNKQASIYDEKDTIYYSKYGKISCNYVSEYLKNIDYNKLLDIGSGTGYLINMLKKYKATAEFYGLDLSEEMINISKSKNIKDAEFILGSANKLPFNDNTFDIVTCIQSFHHYPYPDEAMKEVYRVLKKGGIYILSDTGVGGIAAWIDNNILFKVMKSGDCRTENKEGISKRMLKNGFDVIDKKQIKGFIYSVVGKK